VAEDRAPARLRKEAAVARPDPPRERGKDGRRPQAPDLEELGRYDVACPMRSACNLHRTWPEAKLVVVLDFGHSMTEVGIRRALIAETNRFA
jgi:hypothetical protein